MRAIGTISDHSSDLPGRRKDLTARWFCAADSGWDLTVCRTLCSPMPAAIRQTGDYSEFAAEQTARPMVSALRLSADKSRMSPAATAQFSGIREIRISAAEQIRRLVCQTAERSKFMVRRRNWTRLT